MTDCFGFMPDPRTGLFLLTEQQAPESGHGSLLPSQTTPDNCVELIAASPVTKADGCPTKQYPPCKPESSDDPLRASKASHKQGSSKKKRKSSQRDGTDVAVWQRAKKKKKDLSCSLPVVNSAKTATALDQVSKTAGQKQSAVRGRESGRRKSRRRSSKATSTSNQESQPASVVLTSGSFSPDETFHEKNDQPSSKLEDEAIMERAPETNVDSNTKLIQQSSYSEEARLVSNEDLAEPKNTMRVKAPDSESTLTGNQLTELGLSVRSSGHDYCCTFGSGAEKEREKWKGRAQPKHAGSSHLMKVHRAVKPIEQTTRELLGHASDTNNCPAVQAELLGALPNGTVTNQWPPTGDLEMLINQLQRQIRAGVCALAASDPFWQLYSQINHLGMLNSSNALLGPTAASPNGMTAISNALLSELVIKYVTANSASRFSDESTAISRLRATQAQGMPKHGRQTNLQSTHENGLPELVVEDHQL